jgi:hypothetical protein
LGLRNICTMASPARPTETLAVDCVVQVWSTGRDGSVNAGVP